VDGWLVHQSEEVSEVIIFQCFQVHKSIENVETWFKLFINVLQQHGKIK